MTNYKKVTSGIVISRKIFDALEKVYPADFNGHNRAEMITAFNGIIQGRKETGIDIFLQYLQHHIGPHYPQDAAQLCGEIQDFAAQKQLLSVAYNKSSHKEYKFKTLDLDPDRPLKIINQRIYDSAAKDGFPPDFFRESYFDSVNFYCLPDNADFFNSCFRYCNFIVYTFTECSQRRVPKYPCFSPISRGSFYLTTSGLGSAP